MPINAENIRESFDRALNSEDIFKRNNLEADEWQKKLLECAEKRFLVLAARQSGKSLTAASVACQLAGTLSNQSIIVISPAQRQSDLLIRTCANLIKNARYGHELLKSSKDNLEFRNGSQIIGLPGGRPDNIRGFAKISALILEEAAMIDDETIAAVMPFLAVSDGICIAISSPKGPRGWFYRQWKSEPHWAKIKVTADENKRISKEFLEQQRRELGETMYLQEYECSFLEGEHALISPETISRVFKPLGVLHAA